MRFCDRYINPRSRTHDQMVQAARSGVQNIAEGSQDSGTSKKTELKLTNVARASLEELRLDYEDYLRQRGLAQWPPEHPALVRFKARRCATLAEVRAWVEAERGGQTRTNTDKQGRERSGKLSVPASECAWFGVTRGQCRALAAESRVPSARQTNSRPGKSFRGRRRFHRAALPGAVLADGHHADGQTFRSGNSKMNLVP